MGRGISTRTTSAACRAIVPGLALGLALGPALTLLAADRAAADWSTGRADIAGRWLLQTPSRSYCVMSFSGAPDGVRGTVAAMGFCPRVFLAHPRWWFDAGRVVIGRRHGEPLADLAVVGRGYLKGQIATGEAVSLTR
jgi:hypothetical protein